MSALAAVGTPLSALPGNTTQLLLRAMPAAPRLLTPGWLRGHVRAAAAGSSGAAQDAPLTGLSTAHATALLRCGFAVL